MADLLPYEPEPEISPIVKDAFFDALDPRSSTAIAVKEDGSVAIKANQPPPEAKPKKAEAGAEPAVSPQTPPAAPFTGFGPAVAALAGGGGVLSESMLRGLTPEQIVGLMNVETAKQRLRQGTIGQLLELPYRQALTAKALRPEAPAAPEVPVDVRTRAMEALIRQREREPRKEYPQGDWFFDPDTGEVDFIEKGKRPITGWKRMPSKEQVPKAETVYEKTIAIKALDTLRSYTHDKEGKILDVPDATGISALNETLAKEGKEVVSIRMPSVKEKWLGIDWLKKDLAERMIYVVVNEGADATDAEVKDALVSAYGYTSEEADAVIKLKRGK